MQLNAHAQVLRHSAFLLILEDRFFKPVQSHYHLMCSIFHSNRNSLETQWPNSTFLFCACGPMMEHLKNLLDYPNFKFLYTKAICFINNFVQYSYQ